MTTSAQQLWETSLGQLQLQVPRSSYETWLKGTSGLALDGDALTVAVPTPFAAEWLERRMYQLIQRTIAGVAAAPIQVRFQVLSASENSRHADAGPEESPISPRLPLHNAPLNSTSSRGPSNGSFNPRYTFANFVIGTANQLAYAAASSVAERPGERYNPLFIYSGVGLGKTHLLHAIASSIAQRNLRPLYVTTEQFTNEFILSIRDRKTEDFRAKYRSADVLLLDDIQFLAGKEQTQEGFFHTFNDLHNASRQIVVTCDRPPGSVALLEDRLRSRFEWGLIADIHPPYLETRLAILYSKAQAQRITLGEEAAQAIAARANHSVRELEGCLNRVVALSQFIGEPISRDLVNRSLAAVAPEVATTHITTQSAVAAVARQYNISPEAICTRPQDRKTTLPQRVSMYLLSTLLNQPAAEIAASLGDWHPKTVRNSLDQINQQRELDEGLVQSLSQIKQDLLTPDH